ncbi:MAG: hypothetical protein ACK452_15435 [Bacteroidota bacterium]
MKRLSMLLIASTVLFLTSCMVFNEAGRLNMVSVRNIDSKTNYQMLQKNIEYTKKEMRKNCKETIEQAIDDAVKKVPGGEYLMNAKINVCVVPGSAFNGYRTKCYYIVTGDVWGIPQK